MFADVQKTKNGKSIFDIEEMSKVLSEYENYVKGLNNSDPYHQEVAGIISSTRLKDCLTKIFFTFFFVKFSTQQSFEGEFR